ncbi:MAG TPA: hypothetical protein VMY76_10030 [Gemmatimonadales bacterium]|nr:hypothetical protein [Gemmatimonadales bacterium]
MAAPSLIASRRFSHPLRLRLQVLFAKAFESLADTYRTQAVDFVHRLRGRLGVEEALDRYFREVGVPHPMSETVRSRALIALAPTAGAYRAPETRAFGAWLQLRPDQLFETVRRHAQAQDETSLDCRMAASLSDEAIAATHVAMALETVALLKDEAGPDDAIMHYVRHFNLPSVEAQIIFRRTLAAWAERHPVREPFGDGRMVCAAPVLFASRAPLSLRVVG